MIDVIIPAFNAHKTIEETLFSIASQTIKENIKVTIINDGGKNYDKIIQYFKNFIKIEEIYIENSGPSIARQFGLEKTNNPYIIFIDADDVLLEASVAEKLYNSIYLNKNVVSVNSLIIEENQNKELYLIPENNVWLFGRIYRRSFIVEQGLRFPKISANEDTIFNLELEILAEIFNKEIKFIDQPTYLWKWNSESITRKNSQEYSFFQNKYSAIEGKTKVFQKYNFKYIEKYLWPSLWEFFLHWEEHIFNRQGFFEESFLIIEGIKNFYKYFKEYFNSFPEDFINEYEENRKKLGIFTDYSFLELITILKRAE
jgi:glycosyltransferase involved in cell wall biosynthesis